MSITFTLPPTPQPGARNLAEFQQAVNVWTRQATTLMSQLKSNLGTGGGSATIIASTPLSYNSGTGVLTIQAAGASQSGYLTSADWNTFNNKLGGSSGNLTEATSSVLTITGGTGAVIGSGTTIQVTKADASHSGYLSNTDWNTFNSKQAALSLGNLTEVTSSVLTISGGTGAIIGSGLTIQVKQASGSVSGYLSSTDWTTFNNKQSAVTLGSPLYFAGLQINIHQASAGVDGYLSGADWTTFAAKVSSSRTINTTAPLTGGGDLSADRTLAISVFGASGPGHSTGAVPDPGASAGSTKFLREDGSWQVPSGSPTSGNLTEATSSVLTITGGTGAVLGSGTSIQVKQASGSVSGYLSSTDWTTFNGKQAALSFGNLTEATSSVLTITGGTGAVIGSGLTIQVTQADATHSGYLSSTDWNTFNSIASTGIASTINAFASLPGSPHNGDLALVSDGNFMVRYNSSTSTWDRVAISAGGLKVVSGNAADPSGLASYSWYNQLQSTVSASGGRAIVTLKKTSSSQGYQYTGLVHAKPGSNYTIVAHWSSNRQSNDQNAFEGNFGILLTVGTSGAYILFTGQPTGANAVQYGSGPTGTPTVSVNNSAPIGNALQFSWLKLVCDASNRTFYLSQDGTDWWQVAQISATAYYTTTYCGIGMTLYHGNSIVYGVLDYYYETSP